MWRCLVAIIASCASVAHAQNWALLNPAYRYNYSNDGTDTISNQIRVLDVDTLGVDSFRYELNPIAKVCDTCTAAGLFLLLNQPQFMQRRVNVGSTAWHFHDPGSFVLLPHANMGENWIFDTLANITATVTAVDLMEVFGSDVQRKVISLSDGGSIVISEPLGVLSWNGHELIGEHGPELGRLAPSVEEMFPYHTGDVVEYSTQHGGTDGFSSNYGQARLYKFTVASGSPTEVAMVFDGAMIDHRWNWTSYWNGPAHVTYGHQNSFGNTWTAGRPELPWADLLTSYPGQLIGHWSENDMWSDSLVCIADHGIDDMGRYTIRCKDVQDPSLIGEPPGHFMTTYAEPLAPDDLRVAQVRNWCPGSPDQACGVLYTAGTGLNWLHGNYFESFEEYVLLGSVMNGDTIGTVDTDEYVITLTVHEGVTNLNLRSIAPNPASDHITFAGATGNETITIRDLEGRLVRTARMTSAQERIPVSDIAPGMYLISVDGMLPQRFMIMR